jgi:hypothetical protein
MVGRASETSSTKKVVGTPSGTPFTFDLISMENRVQVVVFKILLGSGSRMMDSRLQRLIPKELGLSLYAVTS